MKILYALTISLIFMMCSIQSLYAQDHHQVADKHVTVTISSFVTGNRYLDMDQSSRIIYVIGVIDGIKLTPSFGISKGVEKTIKSLDNCFNVMSTGQLEAIVWKYLQDNPSKWHEPMNMLIFKAFIDLPCYKEP